MSSACITVGTAHYFYLLWSIFKNIPKFKTDKPQLPQQTIEKKREMYYNNKD